MYSKLPKAGVSLDTGTGGSGAVSPTLVGRIAPTRTEGINMRGIFRFPIEKYADALLPSWASPKIHVVGQ